MCIDYQKDENILLFWAKCCIVVLGNHKDWVWSKSDRFAPVLQGDSLRFLASLAVKKRRPLLTGGTAKTHFVKVSCPMTKLILYACPPTILKHNQRNICYYNVFSMASAAAPVTGRTKSIQSLSQSDFALHLKIPPSTLVSLITLKSQQRHGHDYLALFGALTWQLCLFFWGSQCLSSLLLSPAQMLQNWFHGYCGMVSWHALLMVYHTPFCCSSSQQSGFASNLVESFFWDSHNPTPTATPYCLGIPINSISPLTDDPGSDPWQGGLAKSHCKHWWLATTTFANLSVAYSFLSSYSKKPEVGHMKAALYALHYIHSTYGHGMSFTSENLILIKSLCSFSSRNWCWSLQRCHPS